MKRNALITSIVMLVVGAIAQFYANNASYVDEAGMVHDSIWYPIGGLLIIFGTLILIITAIAYLISFLRSR